MSEDQNRKVTIDGQEYDFAALSDDAKRAIESIQAADRRLAQLRDDTAMVQTARQTYFKILKDEAAK